MAESVPSAFRLELLKDFCVIKRADGTLETALMEVNDGANCGYYEGISDRDFAAMIEARWEELLAPRAVASGLE